MDIKQPSMQLLIKLGSLIVHYEEYISNKGHQFDKIAIDSLRQDAEVIEWMDEMDKLALLPQKRESMAKKRS